MAPLRWIFVGTFTARPSGTPTVVSGSRLADVMAKLAPAVKVDIVDRLGSAGTRSFELRFDRPRALRVQDVVADQSPLKELAEIAGALGRAKDPIGIEEAVARVKGVVGDGGLARAIASTTTTTTTTSTTTTTPTSTFAHEPTASAGGGDIFDKVAMPGTPADTVSVAKSGVDAFVGAMRGGKTAAKSSGDRSASTRAAEIISDAIEATAADALAAPAAASLESAWRGIKMVLSLSPGHGELAVSVLDVADEQQVDALGRVLTEPHESRPDAVFVVPAIADPRRLRELATLAEAATVPVVTAIDPSLLDDDGVDGGSSTAPLERWNALRSEPACQWLVGTTNDIVLANEPTRVGPRIVFGSSVFALAAILTSAFARHRGFADALGKAGAVSSPASHPVDGGAIPTRAALAPDALRALADQGLVAIGHEREGERMLVVGAPVIGRGDGPTFPARILVGRAIRWAIAARDTLPRGASNREIETAFARAGASFLPESPGACTLHAHAHGDHLHVEARLAGSLLGRTLEFAFTV